MVITDTGGSPTAKLKAQEQFWEKWNLGSPSHIGSVGQLLWKDTGKGLGEQECAFWSMDVWTKKAILRESWPWM